MNKEPEKQEKTEVNNSDFIGSNHSHHTNSTHSHSHSHSTHEHSHSKSSSSHSSHSHHSHHSSSSKNKSKFKSFCKNHMAVAVALFVMLVIIIVMTFLLIQMQKNIAVNIKNNDRDVSTAFNVLNEDSSRFDVPTFGATQILIDNILVDYNNQHYGAKLNDFMPSGETIDYAVPLIFRYSYSLPSGYDSLKEYLSVSENADLSYPFTVDGVKGAGQINVSNLKTNTKYYYKLTVTSTGDKEFSVCGNLTTADTPRILTVSGISNVRDIGNLKTTDNKRTVQGMIFRGSETDGLSNKGNIIDHEGITTFTTQLGVRTEIDLRHFDDGENPTPIVSNINYLSVPLHSFANGLIDEEKQSIYDLFTILSHSENYPVYIHCDNGVTATGSACYILEALLGVTEDQALYDYELSALYNHNTNRDDILKMKSNLDACEGDTLQQKAENFVLTCGITSEQIEIIKSLLVK